MERRKCFIVTEILPKMHYQSRIASQREAAFLERGRSHHALRIVAESRRLLGNAVAARIQRAVSIQVLKEGDGIRAFGQAFARKGERLVLHLHAEAREGFLQEIIRRRINGDIKETLHAVDVTHFKSQALGLHPRRISHQKEGGEKNHCFGFHTNQFLISLQTYARILKWENIRDRRQGYVTDKEEEGRTGRNWDE